MIVLLVRHAEKVGDGSADPPLTERGQARASCLAGLLKDFAPTHLLSTEYQRTRTTLAPLAEATGHTVTIIDAKAGPRWAEALAQLPAGARAVVAGHSNTLPALVAGMGGTLTELDDTGNIPHDEYDRLVHVVRDAEGHATIYATTYCGPSGD